MKIQGAWNSLQQARNAANALMKFLRGIKLDNVFYTKSMFYLFAFGFIIFISFLFHFFLHLIHT